MVNLDNTESGSIAAETIVNGWLTLVNKTVVHAWLHP